MTSPAFVLDSEWTYCRTGETYRLLYWERDMVLIRKVRGFDGLVGPVRKLPQDTFRACYALRTSGQVEGTSHAQLDSR